MTDHQRARRARKSKAFFARQAERAALAGSQREAVRLLCWALRKRGVQKIGEALLLAFGAPIQRKAA